MLQIATAAGVAGERDGVSRAPRRETAGPARPELPSALPDALYKDLVRNQLLVPEPGDWFSRLWAMPVDWTCHPKEWCFSQLRDAALAVLSVQAKALPYRVALADASAHHVLFGPSGPALGNACRFVPWDDGPWKAYPQFCRHFLAPLLVMSARPEFAPARFWEDAGGMPLGALSGQMGLRSWLNPDAVLHVHLHHRTERLSPGSFHFLRRDVWTEAARRELVDSLLRAVERVRPPRLSGSGRRCVPSGEREASLAAMIAHAVSRAQSGLIVDIGGGAREYAGRIPEPDARCLSFNDDPAECELLYSESRRAGGRRVLPLLLGLEDLEQAVAPQPGGQRETRLRSRADLVTVIDSIHRFCLGPGFSLDRLAPLVARIGRQALVEWAPPDDPAVAPFLTRHAAGAGDYRFDRFLEAFNRCFTVRRIRSLPGTRRHLFLLEARPGGPQ